MVFLHRNQAIPLSRATRKWFHAPMSLRDLAAWRELKLENKTERSRHAAINRRNSPLTTVKNHPVNGGQLPRAGRLISRAA